MPTVPVTTYDTYLQPSRVGGTGAVLNVGNPMNYRGEDYVADGAGEQPIRSRNTWMDLCFHQGELWCIHSELTVPAPSPTFKLYVQRFTAGSWVQVGTATLAPNAIFSTSCNMVKPSIASDGTTVWVSWWAWGSNCTPITTWRVGMAHWNGTSWIGPMSTGVPAEDFYVSSWGMTPTTSANITLYNGIAVDGSGVCRIAFRQPDWVTPGSPIHVYDSSGAGFTTGSAYSDALTTVPAVTRRDGVTVGCYVTQNDEICLFRMDTGATLALTPRSSLFPYGTDPNAGAVVFTEASRLELYGTSQLVASTTYGPVMVDESGAGGWVGFGGANDWFVYLGSNLGGLFNPVVADTADPFSLWMLGSDSGAFGNNAKIPDQLFWWEPACTTAKVPPNKVNPVPARQWRGATADLLIPASEIGYTNTNPVTDAYLGANRMVISGNHLYVAVFYVAGGAFTSFGVPPAAMTDAAQFIVYDIPICRGCGACTIPTVPVLRNRFPADGVPSGGAAPSNSTSSTKVFEPTKGFPVG